MSEKNFTSTKIRSPYFECEFEFQTFENEEGLTIISHNSLEYVVNNNIPKEFEMKNDIKMLFVSDVHNVAQCTFIDKYGRRIQGIGETTRDTLTNSISRAYPSLTATQRAFDRAAIRYLGLLGKVYSDLEIENNNSDEEKKEATQKEEMPTPGTTVEQPSAPKEDLPMNKRQRLAVLGKTLFTMGDYNDNPISLDALWQKDPASVIWCADNCRSKSGPNYDLKCRCAEYRALKEGL